MVNTQILFLRSAKKPDARWLFRDEESGLLKLCKFRADGDVYSESALDAVRQKIPLIWKNAEHREAWIREIPVNTPDAEVLDMITKWQEENPFSVIRPKPAKPAPASDDAPASAPAVAPTTAPDAEADEWSAE